MNRERPELMMEMNKEIIIAPPAMESFFDRSSEAETWPDNITENKDFQEQVESRGQLINHLENITSSLPKSDAALKEAVENGHLNEAEVVELYKSLSKELGSDSEYSRMVLYIPFEFLPKPDWHGSPELIEATNDFRQAYLESWDSLLSTHDVRANFVDGDVLEPHLREEDLFRVVKAAHLIPKLVEHGMLTIENVLDLIKSSDDEVLNQSIADTIPVLFDLNLITETQLTELKQNLSSSLSETVELSLSDSQPAEIGDGGEAEFNIESAQVELQNRFHDINENPSESKTTERRTAWLNQEKKRSAIESIGEEISRAILEDKISEDVIGQLFSIEADKDLQQAFVEGLRLALEQKAQDSLEGCKDFFKNYSEPLTELLSKSESNVQKSVAKTFYHLRALKVISDQELSQIGLKLPNVDGQASKNLESITGEIGEIKDMVASIENDPVLSQYLYPVAMIYGSKLKGYGDKDSDTDIAVMIKPGTPLEEKNNIREALHKIFVSQSVHGEVIEFWLEETKDGLSVKDFNDPDPALGDSYWTYTLFGSAWEGNKSVIKELREKLLVPYMHDDDKTIFDRDARSLYLEEMERNHLQYRLMHKGYEKFYPPSGGINTPHASMIDNKSMFWDSGYRMMATKLFASRVFLPKISKPE